jgi:hypothetical protein
LARLVYFFSASMCLSGMSTHWVDSNAPVDFVCDSNRSIVTSWSLEGDFLKQYTIGKWDEPVINHRFGKDFYALNHVLPSGDIHRIGAQKAMSQYFDSDLFLNFDVHSPEISRYLLEQSTHLKTTVSLSEAKIAFVLASGQIDVFSILENQFVETLLSPLEGCPLISINPQTDLLVAECKNKIHVLSKERLSILHSFEKAQGFALASVRFLQNPNKLVFTFQNHRELELRVVDPLSYQSNIRLKMACEYPCLWDLSEDGAVLTTLAQGKMTWIHVATQNTLTTFTPDNVKDRVDKIAFCIGSLDVLMATFRGALHHVGFTAER